MTDRLAQRRVLVVGGGTRRSDDPEAPPGNGRAIALASAKQGAVVAVSDVDEAAAYETVAMVSAGGGSGHALAADASDPEACARTVKWAAEVMGGLDGLVLNVASAGARAWTGHRSKTGTRSSPLMSAPIS
jgi:NAD(P)-dependent dehydrogenase (short-subunit alcohol dehydrogenase family)